MTKKTRKRSKKEPVPFGQLEALVGKLERQLQLEQRAVVAERALADLRGRLIALLSEDQVEAAGIAGCAPEVYAIECIEIWKEKIFPSFPKNVWPLHGLNDAVQ